MLFNESRLEKCLTQNKERGNQGQVIKLAFELRHHCGQPFIGIHAEILILRKKPFKRQRGQITINVTVCHFKVLCSEVLCFSS